MKKPLKSILVGVAWLLIGGAILDVHPGSIVGIILIVLGGVAIVFSPAADAYL